jgi:hypothetical protein
MASAFIELHDSDVESIRIENRTSATIRMRVLIHKSEGVAGQDPGTEWMQHAELKIRKIHAIGGIPTDEATIINGILVIGSNSYPNEIPYSLNHDGYFYLSFIFNDGLSFSASGCGIVFTLVGEPEFLQAFPRE